jgi:hypothetical protein
LIAKAAFAAAGDGSVGQRVLAAVLGAFRQPDSAWVLFEAHDQGFRVSAKERAESWRAASSHLPAVDLCSVAAALGSAVRVSEAWLAGLV